jgi:histone H3/H4
MVDERVSNQSREDRLDIRPVKRIYKTTAEEKISQAKVCSHPFKISGA